VNIGEEQEPVEVPVPVHPDDIPKADPTPEPEAPPAPAEPVKVPA
jgi:hypothetical protein